MSWTISPGIAAQDTPDDGGLVRLPMDHPAVKAFYGAGLLVNHGEAFREAVELATGTWYGDILPKDVAKYRDSADWSKVPNKKIAANLRRYLDICVQNKLGLVRN